MGSLAGKELANRKAPRTERKLAGSVMGKLPRQRRKSDKSQKMSKAWHSKFDVAFKSK